MTPFEQLILMTIVRARRDLVSPVAPTVAIYARLPMHVPVRSLRYYLKRMEDSGWLVRPKGPKSGWSIRPRPRLSA